MRVLRTSLAVLCAAALGSSAFAQTYPVNTPTYIPTAVLAPATLAAAGDVVFNSQGLGNVLIRVSGTNTGVAALIQGTNETGASPTYTTLGALQTGSGSGGAISAITGNGLYRVNSSGFARIRVHLTAISTGSVVVAMSGTPGVSLSVTAPLRRATYSAAITALAPAASATDFLTLTGAAGVTVRLNHVECSGISTAAATATVAGLVRSTADTSGTSTAPTVVPHDSSDPAGTATVLAYTANPTVGSLVGIIRSGKLSTNTAATSAFGAQTMAWDFGVGQTEEVTLRGITQVFALNGAAASFTSGAALNCSVTWTEE